MQFLSFPDPLRPWAHTKMVGQLAPARDAQFGVDPLQVVIHCAHRDEKPLGNLLAAHLLGRQEGYLALSL